MAAPFPRKLPVGAEVHAGAVHFRVWAPRRRQVEVVLADGPTLSMQSEEGGYFSLLAADAAPGMLYRFRLDNEPLLYPDPASRFQPQGCHGPSEIIDPQSFAWSDEDWPGVDCTDQIIYEMHIGTFTPEGTFAAAIDKLPLLVEVGITTLEVMPVAEFAGEFGWGYDGVDLYAPTRLYGRPNDFRRFVDAAHKLGLAVILDVVYNHFGPSGNYVAAFSSDYFSKRYKTDWGEPINFDGANSGPVRDFFSSNAAYWIEEFHLDGLRLDAIQAIFDNSPEHILQVIERRVRQAAGGRRTYLVAENELQLPRAVQPQSAGGYGLDAVWNDDFHHAARVAATGHNEFYYSDYRGSPQELISATRWGYLYQGQWNERQQKRRGGPAWDLESKHFVNFLQNHDQVANSARGMRGHELTSPGRHRALTALVMLAPGTPLLFQGQEFSASAPFLYFADHEVDIAQLVRQGRQEFLRQFPSMAGTTSPAGMYDPCDRRTFELCRLDWSQRQRNGEAVALHRDLIRLRRNDPVFAARDAQRLYGAVLSAESFALRYFGQEQNDRLLLVNLGRDLTWGPPSEPLLAPPPGKAWRVLWSSEEVEYGGSGTGMLSRRSWRLPGHAALVLEPQNEDEPS